MSQAAQVRKVDLLESPDFIEETEIRYIIGGSDDGDQVIERHYTTPIDPLEIRTIGLTTPGTASLNESQHIDVAGERGDIVPHLVRVSPTAATPGTPVEVRFEPRLRRSYAWSLAYNIPRLWSPLREEGVDNLQFSVGSRRQRDWTATYVSRLKIHFVFPKDVVDFDVQPAGAEGYLRRRTNPISGRAEVTWICDKPRPAGDADAQHPRYYSWKLHMSQPAGRESSHRRARFGATLKAGWC